MLSSIFKVLGGILVIGLLAMGTHFSSAVFKIFKKKYGLFKVLVWVICGSLVLLFSVAIPLWHKSEINDQPTEVNNGNYDPDYKASFDSIYRVNIDKIYGYNDTLLPVEKDKKFNEAIYDPKIFNSGIHLRYHMIRSENMSILGGDSSNHLFYNKLIERLNTSFEPKSLADVTIFNAPLSNSMNIYSLEIPRSIQVYNAKYEQLQKERNEFQRVNAMIYERYAPDHFQLYVCSPSVDTVELANQFMTGMLAKSIVPKVIRFDYNFNVLPHDSVELFFDVDIVLPVRWSKQNATWHDLDGAKLFVRCTDPNIVSFEISTLKGLEEYTMGFNLNRTKRNGDMWVDKININKLNIHRHPITGVR